MKTSSVLKSASKAVALAETALQEAREALAVANGSKAANASKVSKGSKGTAGRQPSPEQKALRQTISKKVASGEVQFFTIAEMASLLKADRIQTRNAVNYLEQQGAIIRYAEKLPEGRGQREMIYKAGDPEILKAAA